MILQLHSESLTVWPCLHWSMGHLYHPTVEGTQAFCFDSQSGNHIPLQLATGLSGPKTPQMASLVSIRVSLSTLLYGFRRKTMEIVLLKHACSPYIDARALR